MLFRLLLWVLIVFIILKIVRVSVTFQRRSRGGGVDPDLHTPGPDRFRNIPDAEFEDVTPKPPTTPPAA